MPDKKVHATAAGPPGALARPDWRVGGEFTAADLRLEQKYFWQRERRHLRLVHGWGVVCGLNVVAANALDPGDSWELLVCPGYGIGPCGDEILVPARFRFNLRDYLWTRPFGAQANRLWIALEVSEEPLAYETISEADCGCGCGGSGEKASLLSGGFRIVVSWTPPLFAYRVVFDACSGATPACPPCPETCGLTLASVALPASNEPILNSDIDNLGGV